MFGKKPSPSSERRFGLDELETYTLPLDELVKRLKTDPKQGLSQKDVEERLGVFGPNAIPEVKSSPFRIYIAPLLNWLINIFLIASTVLIFIGLFILPQVWERLAYWLIAIAANCTLAIVQQARAQRSIKALYHLSVPKSKTIREGRLVEIPSEQIVPGDVLKLGEGDRIPADARIVTASYLRVNEASLTGESEEIEKLEDDAPLGKETPIYDRRNMVFLGTNIISGSAVALVVSTGPETQLGKISGTLKELNIFEIPLQKETNRLAKHLGIAVLIFLSISLTYHILLLHLSNNLFVGGVLNIELLASTIVVNIITAMSIMPINIPLLTTFILITGALTMAVHKVIVRDLTAIESMGRVSVICSDKTGTITKDEMTVKWIFFPKINMKYGLYGVTGTGLQPNGKIVTIDANPSLEETLRAEPDTLQRSEFEIKSGTPLELLLMSSVLNNDGMIVEEETDNVNNDGKEMVCRAVGDPTDASLCFLFRKSGLDETIFRSTFQCVRNYPFDSSLKLMTKIFKDNRSDRYFVFTKGATESLLTHCNFIMNDESGQIQIFSDKDKSFVDEKARLFSSSGYRVISFSYGCLEELPSKSKIEGQIVEGGLTYLGFVAIIDPPREGVIESVSEASDAGIKTVMITGDSLETGKSIAEQVGIAKEGDLALEGCDLEPLSDEEFMKTTVFARVCPEHKMRIVDRYKSQGHVVAMTGDGVNDAPAIRLADIGISMGITGTDVSKQAAGMIIADDSYNSIILGIRQGRGLFQKIRAIVFFYIAVNLAEALVFFGSSLIPGFHLLNMWQHIYIFMTAHSLPPIALIIDHLSKDVMKEKPRNSEGIFNKQLQVALLLFSLSLALMLYIVYFATMVGSIPLFGDNMIGYVPSLGLRDASDPITLSQVKARTMLLTVAFVAECGLAVSLRRLNKSISRILKDDNYWLIWPFILVLPFAHAVLMYSPTLQSMLTRYLGFNLEVIRLSWMDWIIAISLGLAPIALLEGYKKWLKRHKLSF